VVEPLTIFVLMHTNARTQHTTMQVDGKTIKAQIWDTVRFGYLGGLLAFLPRASCLVVLRRVLG
jgi:hypothetical protein